MKSKRRIYDIVQIARRLGVGFCVFRLLYAFRKRTGLLRRRFNLREWEEADLSQWVGKDRKVPVEELVRLQRSNGRRFFFTSDKTGGINEEWETEIRQQASGILENRFRYFFDREFDLGEGPDWHLNPKTGKRSNAKRHWCDISWFDPSVGDIKFIWEPSRFAWVYTLVRAWAATGEKQYVEKCWALLLSWRDANPPNQGPNWACGQECAIRVMALCFAYYGLGSCLTATQSAELLLMIAVHADRIAGNISFAISTRTNHALTEAAGLYTVGLLFPEFQQARKWHRIGMQVLSREGMRQIYPDGAYIQHSMNYHRLILKVFTWVFRLAELNNDAFSQSLKNRVRHAADFLYSMMDKTSGGTPNYGPNDGALIVPLNTCDYLDYRPVIQAVYYLFDRRKILESGPWDEDARWMFGIELASAKQDYHGISRDEFKEGGYYLLRQSHSWSMVRCHTFRDRPGHADLLHLDLWWQGINVLRDSGSYQYNCEEPWQSYFSATRAHNTITIDGNDQMRKWGRFLWLDWPKATVTFMNEGQAGVRMWQGEHDAFCREGKKAIHRRAILLVEADNWIIIDDVVGEGSYHLELAWHLYNGQTTIQGNNVLLETPAGPVAFSVSGPRGNSNLTLHQGSENPSTGWQSLYYGRRDPAPLVAMSLSAELNVRFVTIVCPNRHRIDTKREGDRRICWRTNDGVDYDLNLEPIGSSRFLADEFNLTPHEEIS